jgi:hypothetical protein
MAFSFVENKIHPLFEKEMRRLNNYQIGIKENVEAVCDESCMHSF